MTDDLVELIARTIYTDSYTQYGTASPERWKRTSEHQREFCRGQARAVLLVLQQQSMLRQPGQT